MESKKLNIVISLLMIICLFFIDITPSLAAFMDDDNNVTRKERQLLKKIDIIAETFPKQIDKVALYATLVHRGNYTDYVNDSYDSDWDEDAYKDQWGNFNSDVKKIVTDHPWTSIIDPAGLLKVFMLLFQNGLPCLTSEVQKQIDEGAFSLEDFLLNNIECVFTSTVEEQVKDDPEHKADKDVASHSFGMQSIDLLTAATIVMLDSSGWIGSYSDENYQKALAGEGLVGNLAENSFDKFFASVFNGMFCTVGALADITTNGWAVDVATTKFSPTASFTQFAEFGSSALFSNTKQRIGRYYTMTSICLKGFIGGTYQSVKNMNEEEDYYQRRKNKIAKEIIRLAETFRELGDSSNVGNSEGAVCYYKIPGIDEEVYGLKVQTILSESGNVSGSPYDDIPGEDLIDFETTYIAGVVYPEVGGYDLETKKAQAVAARSFALTRGNGMPKPIGEIRPENGQWVLRIRTSTSDQVFCHPDLGCGSLSGSMQGTASGADTVYAGGVNGVLTRQPLAPDDEIWTAVNETKGQVAVNSNGEVVHTDFVSTDQNAWASATAGGSSYKEAIINHYSGDGVVDVVADCRGTEGDYDLEAYYEASQSATESTAQPSLDLQNAKTYKTVAEFNQHIKDNVSSAGYGTREGVVAAGISLVGDYIMETGKRLRYDQARRQNPETEGIGQLDFYMDCSSFAWWALYNGGFKLPCSATSTEQLSWAQSNGLAETPGTGVGKAGDFLISNGHAALIIGTYDDGYYIAEFSNWGTGAPISKYSYDSTARYKVINMDSYYSDTNNVR